MTESKKRLLALLNSTLGDVANLPEKIAQENMYLADGFHVDTEFLFEVLNYLGRWSEAGMRVMKALQNLMGITDEPKIDNKKSKEGKKWNVEEVLQHCTFKENILYLPKVQLNPKSYTDVKTWITEAGGKWTGGKIQGFKFDFDATRVASILMSGRRCNLKQEYQFYATPEALADWLVSLSDVKEGYSVLEPSAGTGAIVDAIHRVCDNVEVDVFELMPENIQALKNKAGIRIVGEDFTKGVSRVYDRIFANPPFSKNQDIRHVMAMYDALSPNGGEMCVITSCHWCASSEKVCVDFKKWLNEVGAETHEIPKGIFSESGTDVATMAIVIRKITGPDRESAREGDGSLVPAR